MNLKTVLTWAAVAFLLWWGIRRPHDVAHLVSSIGRFVDSSAHGLSNFVSSV